MIADIVAMGGLGDFACLLIPAPKTAVRSRLAQDHMAAQMCCEGLPNPKMDAAGTKASENNILNPIPNNESAKDHLERLLHGHISRLLKRYGKKEENIPCPKKDFEEPGGTILLHCTCLTENYVQQ
ncbi:hypothetical protein NDU88_011120 [Pleurodeles waltl]|uniref:Uncharacterized protein n=1 Tax=Pleurodeles waltl TaxID=8319 RepID=A0AAV7S303_PLEWA|nr:hypothetical protein NDU88_011120 [Pleurodeles waltl]